MLTGNIHLHLQIFILRFVHYLFLRRNSNFGWEIKLIEYIDKWWKIQRKREESQTFSCLYHTLWARKMPENLAITQIKGRLLGITQLRLSPLVGESITNIVVIAIYFFRKRYPSRIFFFRFNINRNSFNKTACQYSKTHCIFNINTSTSDL